MADPGRSSFILKNGRSRRLAVHGTELASQVSRAGYSACPGCDLPGQLDCLPRASLPGQAVAGQDPASLDLLDLLQRRQRSFVIVVHKATGVAARSQSGAQSDYRATTSEVGK